MAFGFGSLSVSRKIGGMLVLLLLTSFLIHVALILPRFRQHTLEQGRLLLEEKARGIAGSIDGVLEHARLEAERIALLPEVASLDRKRIDPLLLDLRRTTPSFIHFTVQDGRGIVIARPDKPERVGEDRSARDYSLGVRTTGKTTFSGLILTNAGNLSTGIGVPILREDGTLGGVLVGAMGVDERNPGFFRSITGFAMGKSGFASLLDARQEPIASGRTGLSGHPLPEKETIPPPFFAGLARGKVASGIASLGGVPWLVAYAPVPSSGWGVVVQVPLAELPDSSASLLASFLTILLVMLALGILSSLLLVRRLLRPLKALSVGAEGGEGEMAGKGGDEIELLTRRLSRMIARLRGSEQEIRKINAILDTQQENSPDGILVVSPEGRVLSFNRNFVRLWGVPDRFLEEREDSPLLGFVAPQLADPEGFLARVRHLYAHPEEASREEIALRDGRIFDRHSYPMRGKDGVYYGRVWYFRDITQQKRSDQEVRRALREKETLLKEVHHRVKNNLQAVSGILDLQVAYLPQGETARILRESKGRIHTMALLHEKLCMGKTQTHVDLPEYLASLTRHLKASAGVREEKVAIRMEVEGLELNLDTAIPCGLIVTELVTNALKYAFPSEGGGQIGVEVSRAGDGSYRLVVSDDGVGLPPGLDLGSARSLGLHLVRSLVEQLSGTIEVRGGKGTTFVISFREYAEYQGAL